MIRPAFGFGAGAERRRHRRFDPGDCAPLVVPKISALLRILGFGRVRNSALEIVNLSEGGARFIADRQLTAGTKIEVRLRVRIFDDWIRAAAVVCWCHRHPSLPSAYVVAANFANLDVAQKRKIAGIREYLEIPTHRQKERNRRA